MNNKIKLEEMLDAKNLIRLKIFRIKLAIFHGKLDILKGMRKINKLNQKLSLTIN